MIVALLNQKGGVGKTTLALLIEERDDHDAPPDLATNGCVEAAASAGGRSPPSR